MGPLPIDIPCHGHKLGSIMGHNQLGKMVVGAVVTRRNEGMLCELKLSLPPPKITVKAVSEVLRGGSPLCCWTLLLQWLGE